MKKSGAAGLEPIETASRDELRALQLDRLKWSVRHAYDNVAPYRAKCRKAGVHPATCVRLEDLARFPFSQKSDLRDAYPFGLFAVPREQIVRLHASSGTTGKPTVVGYTADRHRQLGQPGRPLDPRLRRPARRHLPRRLRLRPVHRRARRPLRRRAPGLHGGPGQRRRHRAPGAS